MPLQKSDEVLMKQLAGGNKAAAGELYERYSTSVYNYFVRMTKDIESSRDLTQNVFVKILKYRHSWKDDKVFSYWLFRIARNILIDHFNEAKKYYGDESNYNQSNLSVVDSVNEMEAKESFGFLLEAMALLPPGYRELIELNRFQGFTYKEIAATISSNENAVKVKTFRAIKKLKEIYTKIIIE